VAYGGACTDARTQDLVNRVSETETQVVIAVGGGKVSDLGKAVANQMKLPIIILPTLAATCSAYTPLSVIYDEHGEMVRYDVFRHSNDLVLIDPQVILESPIDLMIAGIGDTLAKWYEAEAIISQLDRLPIEIQVARFAAEKCRDILLEESQDALEAMFERKLTPEFMDVVETNIMLGGMVGGFGDDYGRTSGAHSIHDALTLLPASHQHLHGHKVAYGIMVQLAIQNQWQEITRLVDFYRDLDLPKCLADMDMFLSDQEYQLVAKRACEPYETIHYLKETITPEVVESAMRQLEETMMSH
jgi:uncharacterized oxidoreductase